jgi:putative intracellular protease/amidase
MREAEIILLCVRWYLRYSLSYRDLEEMMQERGLHVDHTTIYRWVQHKALEFLKQNKVVGAICHGVLVLARTIDPETGRSVLYGRKLTGLTKRLERAGYYLTSWRLGDYYRTYPEYVEDETVNVLKERSDFMHGGSIRKPFVVEDGNLITARYPEDAHLFAQKLVDRCKITSI